MFQIISVIDSWGVSCELVLRWMLFDLIGGKSTLVQVMAWCRQAASHYPSQCWPRSLSSYGVTRPQWVKSWLRPLRYSVFHFILFKLLDWLIIRYVRHSPRLILQLLLHFQGKKCYVNQFRVNSHVNVDFKLYHHLGHVHIINIDDFTDMVLLPHNNSWHLRKVNTMLRRVSILI